MKEKREILVPTGVRKKLAEDFKVSPTFVTYALTATKTSATAMAIRKKAIDTYKGVMIT